MLEARADFGERVPTIAEVEIVIREHGEYQKLKCGFGYLFYKEARRNCWSLERC